MRRRMLWLAASCATLVVALAPPLDDAAAARFSSHMLQHLVLTMVAAPALTAAGPLGLVLRRLQPATARATVRVLRSGGVRWLVHPASAAAIFGATLALVHLPPVYERALRVPVLHGVEHAALFWSAVLLWTPLIGRDPVPRAGAIARLSSGMLVMAWTVVVGGAISAAPHVLYRSYVARGGAGSTAALADQQTAGALLAVGGMVVMLPLLLHSAWAALAAEERRAQLRDARAGGAYGS